MERMKFKEPAIEVQTVKLWKTIALMGICVVVSFATSFLKLGNMQSPFPAAMIALMPIRYSAAAALGTIAGALMRMPTDGATMLLTGLLVFAIRLICEQFSKLLPVMLPLEAFAAVCLSGGSASDAASWLKVLEGVYYGLFCLGTYLLIRPLREAVEQPRKILHDMHIRLAAMTVLFAACGAGYSITLGGLAIFSVLGVLLLICLTRQAPPLYAGVCGTICGLLLGVSRGQPVLSAALALGCLAMAYIPREGNIKLVGFLGAVTAVMFSFSSGLASMICFYEVTLAALLAACIPQTVFARLGSVCSAAETAPEARSAPVDRYRDAFALSETLSELRSDFVEACKKLDGLKMHCEPADKVAESVCGSCRYKNHCYNTDYDRTMEWLSELVRDARQKRPPTPPVFSGCERSGRLYEVFSAYYHSAEAPSGAKLLARKAVCEQLALMSDIALVAAQLGESAGRDSRLEIFLNTRAAKLGIDIVSVTATAENGRVEVDMTARAQMKAEHRRQLCHQLSEYCGVKIAEPVQKAVAEGYRLTFRSIPKLVLQYGSAQLASEKDGCCGDCLTHYEGMEGQELFVLCDGMGTGGDAAVDGTMAAAFFGQLCARGVTPDVAVRTTNSVLCVRTDTESLSTLDAVIVDVYRARARLIKAGAFTTFLLRSGNVLRFEGSALPIGIIDRPDYQEREIKLNRGDILVMASDGVGDEDWLASKLQNRGNMSPTSFCEAVALEARSRQPKPDDITVAMIVAQ